MNTLELQIYLDRCNDNKTAEMLVCAIHQLEEKKLNSAKEYGFVVNLSRSTEAGSHWGGLYINRKRDGFYVDSFSFSPRSFYLTDFINKNCESFKYNDVQIQKTISKICGMYATCFIVHMANGGTLSSYIGKFSKKKFTFE